MNLLPTAVALSQALHRPARGEYGEELSGDAFLRTRAARAAGPRGRRFTPYAGALDRAGSLLCAPDEAYEQLTGGAGARSTRCSCESYSDPAGWSDARGR